MRIPHKLEEKKARGARLKKARTALGLTQKALAEKYNYTNTQISDWERGNDLIPEDLLLRIEAEVTESMSVAAPSLDSFIRSLRNLITLPKALDSVIQGVYLLERGLDCEDPLRDATIADSLQACLQAYVRGLTGELKTPAGGEKGAAQGRLITEQDRTAKVDLVRALESVRRSAEGLTNHEIEKAFHQVDYERQVFPTAADTEEEQIQKVLNILHEGMPLGVAPGR